MPARRIIYIVIISIIAFTFVGIREACAYVDPGTGTFIWQLVVALFVGVLFYARAIIRKIRSLFGKGSDEN